MKWHNAWQNDRKSVSWGLIGKDELHYQWGFKNELQQILPQTQSISDLKTSNKYIITNNNKDIHL